MNHQELTEYLADREVKYPEASARMISCWMRGESLAVISERQNISPLAAERRLDLAAVALGCSDRHKLRRRYEFTDDETDDPRDEVHVMRDPITDYPAARDMARAVTALTLRTNRSVWGSPAAVRDALLFSSIQHAQQRLDEMHRAGIVRFGRPLDSKGRVRWGVTLCV
ncbi:MAG: hypothetical protein ACO3N4_01365 [Ilumatobacteraceae bacterium]